MAWFDDVDLYNGDVMDDMYAQAVYDRLELKDRTNSDLFMDVADFCAVGLDDGFARHPPYQDATRLDSIKENLVDRLDVCKSFLENFDPKQSMLDFDAESMLLAVQAYYEAPDGLSIDEFVDASFKQDGYVAQQSYDVLRNKIKWVKSQSNGQEILDKVLHPDSVDGYDSLPSHEQLARDAFSRTFARLIEQVEFQESSFGILGGVDVSKEVSVELNDKVTHFDKENVVVLETPVVKSMPVDQVEEEVQELIEATSFELGE